MTVRTLLSVWVTIAVATPLGLHAGPQDAPKSVWDGIYTTEQAERGKNTFGSTCTSCHGSGATGLDNAPSLVGSEFLAEWTGQPVSDFLTRIRTTMPASSPGSLSRQAVADVATYLFKLNGFPAGADELPTAEADLKSIAITEKK